MNNTDNKSYEVVICGAGIAGISAAYHLAVRQDIQNVVLVDDHPPLSLTSDKSTECYRNWWPGPGDAMVAFMNRSIDILEELAYESGNIFHLNRRGYLYLTADSAKVPAFIEAASEPSCLGAGPLRIYRGEPNDPHYQPAEPVGFENQPSGADLFLDHRLIKRHFPYLADRAVAALHARRAGWLSAQQLGMYLLQKARACGVTIINEKVAGLEINKGRICAVRLSTGQLLTTGSFVNAAGPLINDVSRMMGVELPVYSELHLKVAIKDPLQAVPREAPLLIWTDPQFLPWSPEERTFLAEEQDTSWLLELMPPGVHTRPEGSPESEIILMLWEYAAKIIDPVFPPPLDDQYPEIVLRGLSTMLPGFQDYFDKNPRPTLDGGYYTKTKENRPLIGPLPIKGAYLIGALSGYGIMAACAAGELLATHLTGDSLPEYAKAFTLERYADPQYRALIESTGSSGQL